MNKRKTWAVPVLFALYGGIVSIIWWRRFSQKTPTPVEPVPQAEEQRRPSAEGMVELTIGLLAVAVAFGTIGPFYFGVSPLLRGLLDAATVFALIACTVATYNAWQEYERTESYATRLCLILIYTALFLLALAYVVIVRGR